MNSTHPRNQHRPGDEPTQGVRKIGGPSKPRPAPERKDVDAEARKIALKLRHQLAA